MRKNKVLSLLLTLTLLMSLTPSAAFATDDIQNSECMHEHTSECIFDEADVCTHAHDDSCGSLSAPEPLADGNEVLALESSGEELPVDITSLAELPVVVQGADEGSLETYAWEEFEYNGVMYLRIDDDTNAVFASGWGTAGTQETLRIPAVVNDGMNEYQVTRIKPGAFMSNNFLIADLSDATNLTNIGQSAFAVSSIETIIFPDSGSLEIDELAFDGCERLSSLSIPASVTRLGEGVFLDCTALTSLDLSSASNLRAISAKTFQGCSNLNNVKIPDTVTQIMDYAFNNCNALTDLDLSDATSLNTIGAYAFHKTGISEQLSLPSSLRSIGASAFRDLKITGTLTLPSGLTSIGASAFKGTGISGTVIIPSGVTTIEDEVFASSSGIDSIILPDNIISIGANALKGTGINGTFTLPSGLVSIGAGAFQGTGISGKLTLPSSVTSIGDSAFEGCTSLSSLVLPSTGSIAIGAKAFQGSGITGPLVLPTSVTSIGDSAFYNTAINGTLIFPQSLTTVEGSAFSNTQLTSADLRAFEGTLGERVFQGSSNLSTLWFDANPAPAYEALTFYGLPSLGTVNYPSGATGYTPEDFAGKILSGWTFTPYTSEARTFTVAQVGGVSETATSTHIEIVFDSAVAEDSLTASHIRIQNGSSTVGVGALTRMGETTWRVALNSVTRNGDITVEITNFSSYTVDTPQQTVEVYREITGPSVPQNLSVSTMSKSLLLSWSAPADDGGADITGYEVSSDGKTWTEASNSTHHTFTGLTNYSDYTLWVRAVNTKLTGAAASKEGTPIGPPGAPTNVTLTAGPEKLDISWTAPNAGESEIEKISRWEISVSDGEDNWVSFPISYVTKVTKHFLKNGTEYTVKIRAVNGLGTGDASEPVVGTPCTTPSAPVALRVTPGYEKLFIEWDTPYDGGSPITEYEVSVSDDQDSWGTISESGATTVSYLVEGLSDGTEYTVKIRAVNSAGNGKEAFLTAIPLAGITTPSAPRNLTAVPASEQVTLSWQPPENNGGAAITKYEVSKDGGSSWTAVTGSTSYTFSGLTNGTSYDFCVRAINDKGKGSQDTVQAIPATTSSAPQKLTTTPGNGQITLNWTAPLSNGGSTITGFEVSEDGATWIPAAASTSHTFSGLTNGTLYTLYVRALNSRGVSAEASVISKPLASPMVPQAPQNLVVTPGDSKLGLSWDPPASNNGSAIIKYQYSISTGSDEWNDVPFDFVNSISVPNLQNDTTYTVKVRAVNEKGPGLYTSSSGTPAAFTATAPDAPGDLTVTPTDGALSISWKKPADGGSIIANYQISVTSDGSEDWKDRGSTGAATESASITGLTNTTTYTVKVRAVNSAGEGLSAVAYGTPVAEPTVPDAPVNLTATSLDGALTLHWETPSNGGSNITGYEILVSPGSSQDWEPIPSGPSTISYPLTGLENNTVYTIKLRAKNSNGEGATAEVTATPKKPAASLSFTDDSAFDIPASIIDVAITAIDVSPGVAGGTTPYTFSASDLPAGITISADGVISGTPTALQAAGTATITVTDAVESTAVITISYGAVSDPPHSLQTFKNDKTGVIVKVHAAADAKLIVTEGILHAEGTCVACDTIRKSDGMLALYDISIEGEFSGTIEISIPVPASYKGKTILVRHCKGSSVEEVELIVKNGYATGTFLSLSPFALFPVSSPTPESPTNPVNPAAMPHTGDSNVLPLCLGIVAAALAAIGCVRVRQNKRRTE